MTPEEFDARYNPSARPAGSNEPDALSINPADADALGGPPEEDDRKVGDAWYDKEKKEYLLESKRGIYLSLSETSFKRHLKSFGYDCASRCDGALSEGDEIILEIQNRRDVAYVGPLCGKKKGFQQIGKVRCLVTESFELPEPKAGPYPNIEALILGLLGSDKEHGQNQMAVFHGWMQLAQKALRAGQIQAAQALAIAGPPGCGKSLIQTLITFMLGDRSAKPYRYMAGETPFNGELFGAEHLMLEDEFMSRRTSDRLKLGAAIKNFCVSSHMQSCHCKGRPAINLGAWWRLTITLNDEPEALRVLPPMDESIADKFILLRAAQFEFPMPMGSGENAARFMAACKAETPAYLYWLLNAFTLPGELCDPTRYGVASWHNPALRGDLETLSPEAELLALADEVLWSAHPVPPFWRGSADDLKRELFADSSIRMQATKLLAYHGSCGTYLGRLVKKTKPRVHAARTSQRREYIITRPCNNI